MTYSVYRMRELVALCFCVLFWNTEGLRKSWRMYKDADDYNQRGIYSEGTVIGSPKGLALNGYLASVIEYSYIVSYHYKQSGRLFCSGFIVSPYWTVSVPNCFHMPTYYYRNTEKNDVRKRETGNNLFGNLSMEESFTVKPQEYSESYLNELRHIVPLKPEAIVVLTVFDKVYIPCKSEDVRTGRRIIIHRNYKIPSHDAEIALVKVSDSLTSSFEIKIPTIAPIDIEGAQHITCHVAGYGSLKLNKSMYSHALLSIIDVDVFAPDTCETISKTYNVVINAEPSHYVCSYNMKYRYGSPLSQGDSGAPLICGDKVVGISQWVFSLVPGFLSFGPSQPTPHLYTKLDAYVTWISKYVNETDKKHFSNFRRRLRTNSVICPLYDTKLIIFMLFSLIFV